MSAAQPERALAISREAISLRFQVTGALREAILAGEFAPGERLVERDLCARLDVSRALLREALQHLQAEGLIAIVPHKGPSVATVDPAEARDIYSVRDNLEGLVVEGFCQHASAAQLSRLRQTLNHLKQPATMADITLAIRAKNQFYDILLEGCGNQVVGQILRQLHNRVTLLRRVSMAQPRRLAESVVELDALVSALEARDAPRARALCSEHLSKAAAAAMRSFAAPDAASATRA